MNLETVSIKSYIGLYGYGRYFHAGAGTDLAGWGLLGLIYRCLLINNRIDQYKLVPREEGFLIKCFWGKKE